MGTEVFEEDNLPSSMAARREHDKIDTSLIMMETHVPQPTKHAKGIDYYAENSGLSNKKQKGVERDSEKG